MFIKEFLNELSPNSIEWTELKMAKLLDKKDPLKDLRKEFNYPKSSTLPEGIFFSHCSLYFIFV